MRRLRELGWPNLLVAFRSNADIPCPDCLPMERIYYWNGPADGEVGSGFYQDPEPGQPGIPPDCDPEGSFAGHLDCGRQTQFCDPPCPTNPPDDRWQIGFSCNANATASEGCIVGELESISCDPFLLRGIKLCCPPGVQAEDGGTLSGCCGEPDLGGQGPPGCWDVEVTLAP